MSKIDRSEFPDDDDGEVLFALASEGVDLSRKRELEFYCYAENESTAEKIADDLSTYGYRPSLQVDGDQKVSVYLAIVMLPSYDLIVLEQKRLDIILARHKTRCDGWMTGSD